MTLLEPELVDTETTDDQHTHFACCDADTGPAVMLCGIIEECEGTYTDEVSCPVCMLADEMDTCPQYGTCRYTE